MVFLSIFSPLVNLVALKAGLDVVSDVTKTTAQQAKRSKGIYGDITGNQKPLKLNGNRNNIGRININAGKPININTQGILKDLRKSRGLI